jgi:hypothetical protein
MQSGTPFAPSHADALAMLSPQDDFEDPTTLLRSHSPLHGRNGLGKRNEALHYRYHNIFYQDMHPDSAFVDQSHHTRLSRCGIGMLHFPY